MDIIAIIDKLKKAVESLPKTAPEGESYIIPFYEPIIPDVNNKDDKIGFVNEIEVIMYKGKWKMGRITSNGHTTSLLHLF